MFKIDRAITIRLKKSSVSTLSYLVLNPSLVLLSGQFSDKSIKKQKPALQPTPLEKKEYKQKKRADLFKTELKMPPSSPQAAAGVSLDWNRDQLSYLNK